MPDDVDLERPPEGAPPRNPKAEAAAAKAYAKAQRPWYKKKRWIFSIGAILPIVVVAAAAGGGSDESDNGSSTAQSTPTAEAPAQDVAEEETPTPEETQQEEPVASGAPTADLPISDGDWRMDSIRVKNDGLGDFGGTARVTYTGDDPEGGTNVFTVTVFVDGKDVAALQGSADAVESGRAGTVQLISTDKFVEGPYEYDFQNDL